MTRPHTLSQLQPGDTVYLGIGRIPTLLNKKTVVRATSTQVWLEGLAQCNNQYSRFYCWRLEDVREALQGYISQTEGALADAKANLATMTD